METLYDILKILLPSLVVFFTAYYSIKLLTKNDKEKKAIESRSDSQKEITMLRLQAYERITLFLERISLSSLITRVSNNKLSPEEFHLLLLTEIRREFEHNITQQLYISHEAWKTVVDTKETIVKIINLSKVKLPKNSNLVDFTKAIIENDLVNETPTMRAIEFIKKEARELF